MKRFGMALVIGALLLALTAGIAWAADIIRCDGAGDRDPDRRQCEGTRMQDSINGNDYGEVIRTLGGSDGVGAGGGNDEIRGDGGFDQISGENGDDTYYGGDGNDVLQEVTRFSVGRGNDEMFAGAGSDFLSGGPGSDKMFGDKGSDFINAADQETPGSVDIVDCGPGTDDAIVNRNDAVKNCETVTREANP